MVEMARDIQRLSAQLNALNTQQVAMEERMRQARAEYMKVQKVYEGAAWEANEHSRLLVEVRSEIQATQMRFINLWISHMSGGDE